MTEDHTILDDLRKVSAWADDPNANGRPREQFERLAGLPLRDLNHAIDAVTDPNEYERLAVFAADRLRNDRKRLRERLYRDGIEFQAARQQAGISQEQAAKETGTSVSTIRRWENDDRYPPSLTAWEQSRTWLASLDRDAQWLLANHAELRDLHNRDYDPDDGPDPWWIGGITFLWLRDQDTYDTLIEPIRRNRLIDEMRDANGRLPTGMPETTEPPYDPFDPDDEREYERRARHARILGLSLIDRPSYTQHNAAVTLACHRIRMRLAGDITEYSIDLAGKGN
ncbi:helix-turn-helix domain-containing protein [Bifidobacterium sp. SO1]|uniref:helix-turn-helix domain-containing protein n=1 Tax=Bifidobacterium sp. SO1 TaxID=2809029 RepID=UPI001BDD626B|nr:helix-turn-helix domain-containing protein [Bifidobacterium sp. SO1]MBT1161691.1 helix-turn-helix domain-containing protein [Bifidobacterium sp. SO1]